MANVPCPSCSTVLAVPDQYAGRRVVCSSCQKPFDVPDRLEDLDPFDAAPPRPRPSRPRVVDQAKDDRPRRSKTRSPVFDFRKRDDAGDGGEVAARGRTLAWWFFACVVLTAAAATSCLAASLRVVARNPNFEASDKVAGSIVIVVILAVLAVPAVFKLVAAWQAARLGPKGWLLAGVILCFLQVAFGLFVLFMMFLGLVTGEDGQHGPVVLSLLLLIEAARTGCELVTGIVGAYFVCSPDVAAEYERRRAELEDVSDGRRRPGDETREDW